jgi:hypothetical protein
MTTQIIFWALTSYGFTNIVVFSKLFTNFREFFRVYGESELIGHKLADFIYELLTCPMCFGTWSGFILSLVMFSPTHMLYDTPLIYSWFIDGILSSGCVWIINSIIEYFEENRPT